MAVEPRLPGSAEFARNAEQLGVDSLGGKCGAMTLSPGWPTWRRAPKEFRLGTFVVQLGSRSPALLASAALSLQELSDGRSCSASEHPAPESWKGGMASGSTVLSRPPGETVEIIRIVSHGDRLLAPGEIYPCLCRTAGACPAALVRPGRCRIYNAAMGPQNLRLTGEVADGWLETSSSRIRRGVPRTPARRAKSAGRTLAELDLVAPRRRRFHDHAR